MTMKLRLASGGAAIALAFTSFAPAFGQLDAAVSEAEQATAAAAASQERIDRIDEEKGDLFREYRALLQQIDSQKLYVDQQRIFLQSQANELTDLERQITEVEGVLRDLTPMQRDMVTNLESFVRLDTPFLRQERTERVSALRDLLDDHNVPPAEGYRKIIEAYEIENEYGRFLRHYEGGLWTDPDAGADPDAPTVDFLMIGRVAFLYMTQDESEIGIWDNEAKAWTQLDGSYRVHLRKAVRMAKEVTTPDVFFGPVPGPTSAR